MQTAKPAGRVRTTVEPNPPGADRAAAPETATTAGAAIATADHADIAAAITTRIGRDRSRPTAGVKRLGADSTSAERAGRGRISRYHPRHPCRPRRRTTRRTGSATRTARTARTGSATRAARTTCSAGATRATRAPAPPPSLGAPSVPPSMAGGAQVGSQMMMACMLVICPPTMRNR